MENCSFQCAAMIGFEQTMYSVMEGLNPTVDVCVTVRNGRVANNLTVHINALPTSTATGQGSMFSAYLELLEGKLLWFPPLQRLRVIEKQIFGSWES